MYSYEERMKAVQLYMQYDLSLADTIRTLGYPDPGQLKGWYKEFIEQGDLHQPFQKPPKYASAAIQAAIDYYVEHGRNISRTIRKLGYLSRPTLRAWLQACVPQPVKQAELGKRSFYSRQRKKGSCHRAVCQGNVCNGRRTAYGYDQKKSLSMEA